MGPLNPLIYFFSHFTCDCYIADEVFGKAHEYLSSGSDEVWLVFPQERWVIVITHSSRTVYAAEENLSSYVLQGFNSTVNALLG